IYLRQGVKFSDGRPLTAGGVKWTLDSVRDGSLLTPKASTFRYLKSVEARDDSTVIVHLNEPYAALLWNLSDGAIGIVPSGSGADFNRHPIGSGPFRLVSMSLDREVILER